MLSMKALRSILSLFFAGLVLISSTSFLVGIHHCGGQVRSIALFDKAEPCEMERQVPPCHRIATGSCCQDVTVVHENEDFNSFPSFELSPSFSDDALATTILLAEIVPVTAPTVLPVYHPPVLLVDRPAALQVFLI